MKTERALDGTYEFYGVYDFAMNGRPTVVAANSSNAFSRIDWDASFTLATAELLPAGYSAQYYDNLTFHDYLGDGYMYLFASNNNGSDGRECLVSLTPESTVNTAPGSPDAPHVIADRFTGNVKVEWDAASDKESAPEDLDYEVRMSSGSTVMYDCKTSGNVFVIANSGTWDSGTVSVQVRAIDANGQPGEWSDGTEFENTALSADFVLSSTAAYLADTITATATAGTAITFRALPDGSVIEVDGKTARIVFADMGTKIIEASVSGGNTVTRKITVSPIKREYHDGLFPVDLDGDGQVEAVTSGKINTFTGGKYEPYPSLSLSDVEIYAEYVFDKNMDGKPDLYGGHRKGGEFLPWLVNNGGLDLTTDSEEITISGGGKFSMDGTVHGICDIDNDGYPDFFGSYLYKNHGNWELEKIPVQNSYGKYSTQTLAADFNRDGLTDLLVSFGASGKQPDNELYLCINKGGFDFDVVRLEDMPDTYTYKVTDVNGDGWPDLAYTLGEYDSFDYRARLGGKDLKFTDDVSIPGLPLNFDFDNDGRMDYAVAADSLLFDREGGAVTALIPEADFSNYNALNSNNLRLFDVNNDGYPDGYEGWGLSGWLYSRYANTAPEAPSQVYVTQNEQSVVLNWSGGSDRETPSAYLRYNVSVREKGTDNYIISPLNFTSDAAATPEPGWQAFRYGSTMPVPFSRFTAGKTYEVCVQTIDPWNSHSAFSRAVEFTPASKVLVSIPAKGGVGVPVEFAYTANVEGTPAVDADGGEISGNTIVWNTPGLKTVTVTAGSAKSEHKVMILSRPSLDISLPARVLGGAVLTAALPEVFASADGEARITSGECAVAVDATGKTATLTMPETDGEVEILLSYEDSIFGKIEETKRVGVVGSAFRPEITMVSVEGGRNRITWDGSMALPDAALLSGTVNVYKETAVADEFEKIAEVSLSDGEYTDEASRPDVETSRYMLTLNTVYGSESRPGRVHGNIHVMINRGLGNDINLHWMPYEGAEIAQYTVMAGTSPDNLSVLETLSGHSQSFTHKRDNDVPTYYSLAYKLADESVARIPGRHYAPADAVEGASNVISTAEAYNVTMVEGIEIVSSDGGTVLDGACPSRRLKAVVTPLLATIATVEWSIADGNELASVSADGVLTIKDNATGGTVRVQAKAVDGSGVVGTADFSVSSYSGISASEAVSQPVITVNGHTVVISGLAEETDILVTDMAGRVEYRSKAAGSLRIGSLSSGLHIVRAGATVVKVVLK